MSTPLLAVDKLSDTSVTVYHLRHCSPRELLARSQGGDSQARHCLLGRYQGLINALAWRMTANSSDAEDMISESYLRVYGVLNTCRDVDTLPGWIKRITINVFNRLHDKKRRAQEISLESLVEMTGDHFLPVTETYPEKQVLDKFRGDERLQRLRLAVRTLPDPARNLVESYYGSDQSYQEIRDQTGLSLGTIKSRLFRAREELQRKLRDLIV